MHVQALWCVLQAHISPRNWGMPQLHIRKFCIALSMHWKYAAIWIIRGSSAPRNRGTLVQSIEPDAFVMGGGGRNTVSERGWKEIGGNSEVSPSDKGSCAGVMRRERNVPPGINEIAKNKDKEENRREEPDGFKISPLTRDIMEWERNRLDPCGKNY